MAYAADDLRAVLNSRTDAAPAATETDDIAAPQFLDFTILPPDVITPGGSLQWIVRSQNLVLIYTKPAVGDVIWDATLATEHVVLLVDSAGSIRGTVTGDATAHDVDGPAMVVVPPGASELISTGTGPVVSLLEASEQEWAAKASNAAAYAQPHPRVAPLVPWPEPAGGYAWRVYRTADAPKDPKRFGRLYRTRSFMVNFFDPQVGARGMQKMGPHSHDDFEQISLVVDGTFVHHIRTPWGRDGTKWRPDDHERIGGPSVTIIPPPTVHDSRAIGWGANHLLDIFCGPRADFSAQPGWVLNADDYPAP